LPLLWAKQESAKHNSIATNNVFRISVSFTCSLLAVSQFGFEGARASAAPFPDRISPALAAEGTPLTPVRNKF